MQQSKTPSVRKINQHQIQKTYPATELTTVVAVRFASVSYCACLFLKHLRCRCLWIIRETGDQWNPVSRAISLFDDSEAYLLDNDVNVFISVRTSLHAAARTPVDCTIFLNFSNILLILFFVQSLFGNSVINCQALYLFCSYKLLIKLCLPCWKEPLFKSRVTYINCVIATAASIPRAAKTLGIGPQFSEFYHTTCSVSRLATCLISW